MSHSTMQPRSVVELLELRGDPYQKSKAAPQTDPLPRECGLTWSGNLAKAVPRHHHHDGVPHIPPTMRRHLVLPNEPADAFTDMNMLRSPGSGHGDGNASDAHLQGGRLHSAGGPGWRGTFVTMPARRPLCRVPGVIRGIVSAPAEVLVEVYFCTLEALQNVAKYAGATKATVRLAVTDRALSFAVTDDGAGVDTSTTSYGTGLQGMADRLSALGGHLTVTASPGEGTTGPRSPLGFRVHSRGHGHELQANDATWKASGNAKSRSPGRVVAGRGTGARGPRRPLTRPR